MVKLNALKTVADPGEPWDEETLPESDDVEPDDPDEWFSESEDPEDEREQRAETEQWPNP